MERGVDNAIFNNIDSPIFLTLLQAMTFLSRVTRRCLFNLIVLCIASEKRVAIYHSRKVNPPDVNSFTGEDSFNHNFISTPVAEDTNLSF